MIHIIDCYDIGVKHNDHWRTTVPQMLVSAGYEVNLISGAKSVIASDNLFADVTYKASQYQTIYENLIMENYNSKDIFIFADAWNQNIFMLRYLMDMLDKKKMSYLGFWKDGVFDVNSRIRYVMLDKKKEWLRSFERMVYRAYDVNCFIYDRQVHRFLQLYKLRKGRTEIVTGLPFDIQSIRNTYPTVEKENIIIIPHATYDQRVKDMIEALARQLSDYSFIDASSTSLSRNEYYELLNKAKIILVLSEAESDPTSVYEGMTFGCMPVVPDISIYKDTFPDKYKYLGKIVTSPFLNFVRNKEIIPNKIITSIANYDTDIEDLKKFTESYRQLYFDHTKFLTVINNLNERANRPTQRKHYADASD